MLDENWTPSDGSTERLYFHCPNTNCDGHVKLKDRLRHHAVRCEKCGLDFALAADPQMQNGERRALAIFLDRQNDAILTEVTALRDRFPAWLVFTLGTVFGLFVGFLIAKGGIT
jgi:hypothetical protein